MNRKPRIAILGNFPIWEVVPDIQRPGLGHYAVWLSALGKLFCEQDEFEIHWICLNKQVKKRRVEHWHNQIFHILPRARKMIGLYTAYIYDRHLVAKELKAIQPDLLHAWGTEDCYALCGKDFKGKKMLSIQGNLHVCQRYAPISGFEAKHMRYELSAIEAFTFISTESTWAAKEVQHFLPEKEFQRLEYAVEERFFHCQRNLAPQPYCLYAGSPTAVKNMETLLKAFHDPRLQNIRLILAGVGPDYFPEGIPANIEALGRVNRNRMKELMETAWCLVHPSLADTGPTIVKEARVCGMPVIVSTHCGSQQYVEEGLSGFIIEPMDREALINSVLKVCASRETAERMGQHGMEECRRKLSAQSMKERILELYREALAQ